MKPKATRRELSAIFIPSIFGWIFTYLAINIFKDYAFGLFIWLPLSLGLSSTIICGYKDNVVKKSLRETALLTFGVFCIGLLAFAFEGLICLIMAAPIGLFFTWIGYLAGYQIIKNTISVNQLKTMIIILISVPLVMGFEHFTKENEDIRFVTTSIIINASPETVWENVISFPELDEPTEVIFKIGISYPKSAEIDGHGVGSVRYCNFSTGSFIEPITAWNEPELLEFDVLDQPDPMKEISPYQLQTNHLQNYWVSKKGQFKLTRLDNGNTLLEGTTWYVNKIKPDIYWTIWSDYIVHTIHERVLEHIKIQSEFLYE